MSSRAFIILTPNVRKNSRPGCLITLLYHTFAVFTIDRRPAIKNRPDPSKCIATPRGRAVYRGSGREELGAQCFCRLFRYLAHSTSPYRTISWKLTKTTRTRHIIVGTTQKAPAKTHRNRQATKPSAGARRASLTQTRSLARRVVSATSR